LNRENKTL